MPPSPPYLERTLAILDDLDAQQQTQEKTREALLDSVARICEEQGLPHDRKLISQAVDRNMTGQTVDSSQAKDVPQMAYAWPRPATLKELTQRRQERKSLKQWWVRLHGLDSAWVRVLTLVEATLLTGLTLVGDEVLPMLFLPVGAVIFVGLVRWFPALARRRVALWDAMDERLKEGVPYHTEINAWAANPATRNYIQACLNSEIPYLLMGDLDILKLQEDGKISQEIEKMVMADLQRRRQQVADVFKQP